MLTLDNGYVFVEHKEWSNRPTGGRSNGKPRIKLQPKLQKVFIHHTVTMSKGDPHKAAYLDPSDDPCLDARRVETILSERGLLPGYNYLVHPAGIILGLAEGYVGAHTAGHNSSSISFSLIGNFDHQHPTLPAFVNIARTINLLRLGGQLHPDLNKIKIMGHRDVAATACPGINVKNALAHIRAFAEEGV